MRVPGSGLNNEINVTPFLDVLLVLIVIFLTTVKAQRVMEAYLPVPATDGCTVNCESIVLEVLPGGEFALNHTRFSRAELVSRIHAAFDGRPTSILFVKGHPGVPYQDVVSAMDEAKGAGVKVLAIATKQVR